MEEKKNSEEEEEEGVGSEAVLNDPEQRTAACEDFHLHMTALT